MVVALAGVGLIVAVGALQLAGQRGQSVLAQAPTATPTSTPTATPTPEPVLGLLELESTDTTVTARVRSSSSTGRVSVRLYVGGSSNTNHPCRVVFRAAPGDNIVARIVWRGLVVNNDYEVRAY